MFRGFIGILDNWVLYNKKKQYRANLVKKYYGFR